MGKRLLLIALFSTVSAGVMAQSMVVAFNGQAGIGNASVIRIIDTRMINSPTYNSTTGQITWVNNFATSVATANTWVQTDAAVLSTIALVLQGDSGAYANNMTHRSTSLNEAAAKLTAIQAQGSAIDITGSVALTALNNLALLVANKNMASYSNLDNL